MSRRDDLEALAWEQSVRDVVDTLRTAASYIVAAHHQMRAINPATPTGWLTNIAVDITDLASDIDAVIR